MSKQLNSLVLGNRQNPTLKVGFWERQEQVLSVTAIYVQATFVHIRNISAVTAPILAKLFAPNFLEVLIFVDQNFC